MYSKALGRHHNKSKATKKRMRQWRKKLRLQWRIKEILIEISKGVDYPRYTQEEFKFDYCKYNKPKGTTL